MPAYQDYETVNVYKDENNKLIFQSESFWFPHTVQKRVTEIMEEKVQTDPSIREGLTGCVNGFSIPVELTDFFIEEALPKLPHTVHQQDGQVYWKLCIKTAYNEKNDCGVLSFDGVGLEDFDIYSERELQDTCTELLGGQCNFIFALKKHITDDLFFSLNLRKKTPIIYSKVKFVIEVYNREVLGYEYSYQSPVMQNVTWTDFLKVVNESGLKRIREVSYHQNTESGKIFHLKDSNIWDR